MGHDDLEYVLRQQLQHRLGMGDLAGIDPTMRPVPVRTYRPGGIQPKYGDFRVQMQRPHVPLDIALISGERCCKLGVHIDARNVMVARHDQIRSAQPVQNARASRN